MSKKPFISRNGVTIAELKKLLVDWPEQDEDGEAYEVWVGTGYNLSSPVTAVWPLNRGDILLESNTDEEKATP